MIFVIAFLFTIFYFCYYFSVINTESKLKTFILFPFSILKKIVNFLGIVFLYIWKLINVLFFSKLKGYSKEFTNTVTGMFSLSGFASVIILILLSSTESYVGSIALAIIPIVIIQIPVLFYNVSMDKSIEYQAKESNILTLLGYIAVLIIMISYIPSIYSSVEKSQILSDQLKITIQYEAIEETDKIEIISMDTTTKERTSDNNEERIHPKLALLIIILSPIIFTLTALLIVRMILYSNTTYSSKENI